jgi:hypothetical protein
MIGHLENIEKILCYTLEQIKPETLIQTLYEKTNSMIEKHVTHRDIENFASYFKFVLSSAVVPKQPVLDERVVAFFVNRTYAGFDEESKQLRIKKIFEYAQERCGAGAEINSRTIKRLEKALAEDLRPTFEKVRERILVATMLKWLQGPLQAKLSSEVNDYVTFIATSFGQYEGKRILNVEKITHHLSKLDRAAIVDAYADLEIAVMEAISDIRRAREKLPKASSGRDTFRVIFDSLDNLVKGSSEKDPNDISVFKDKLLVSTALIYLQDELVEKDVEVKNLIQLFVALYYQFRDKRHPAESAPKN